MSDQKIRVGVIGVGQMGTYHARIYQDIHGVELVALAESSEERRSSLATEFPLVNIYSDYRELIERDDIDAVSIVLPDNMHRDAVEMAVRHDKHILLEKPLTKDLDDAYALYEILKDYDKVFTTGFLLRFDPRFSSIKDRIQSGKMGDIVHAYVRRNSPIIGPRRYIGASDLSMHVMIHDIDYLNWWIDSPVEKVFAKSRSVRLSEYGMNDVIYAILTYANGVIACLEACWVLPENSPTIIDDKVEIVGTKAVAYIDSCDYGVRFIEEEGTIEYPDSRHWYEVNGHIRGDLYEELNAFITNIVCEEKSIVTVEQSLESVKIVDAIERSLAEGREVTLD